MRKVEIKPEKHDKGWLAVERVNNRIVWKSSNFAVEELAQERAISDGILPEPIKTVRNGSKARIFKFDEIKGYFNFLKELPNGKPTSSMGA